MTEGEGLAGVDPDTPSPARLYDFYLGGTHNFPVDRAAGEKLRAAMPDLEDAAWANRGFLGRAAQWLAGTAGVRQFIDIGAGLPTQNNTHEAVHKVAPDARILYVDYDPEVEAYAKPLIRDLPTVDIITADLREPDVILNHPGARAMIDFAEPVGLLMTAVVHFVADENDPWSLMARYRDAVAPGSYLALSHVTADKQPARPVQAIYELYENATEKIHLRPKADVERLFAGWALMPPFKGAEPEVTWIGLWGADDPEAADDDGSRWLYAGVGRKPSDAEASGAATAVVKPTVSDLGIDVDAQSWRRSGEGAGAIEIAFVTAAGDNWVLMRVAGDPSGRVQVYDRREWEAFLDGAKKGEFDDAAG
jgi:hypothetical protein